MIPMDMLELIHTDVVEGFRQVNARLDALNGRVRAHGEQIAVLEAQYEQATAEKAADKNKRTTIVAGVATVVTTFLLEGVPWITSVLRGLF